MEIESFIFESGSVCEAVFAGADLTTEASESVGDCLLKLGILPQFSPDGLSLILQHLDSILPTLSRIVIFALYCTLLWWVYDATPHFY
ncbi:hypothetical protein [Coleofasciculus sp. E1-EBD-02]|uniref:hypothetical protein n=1 Tax=Coleofasciculus sp. E1-EBD-02 TaxID=3068481 RepID=UPI0032FBCF2A